VAASSCKPSLARRPLGLRASSLARSLALTLNLTVPVTLGSISLSHTHSADLKLETGKLRQKGSGHGRDHGGCGGGEEPGQAGRQGRAGGQTELGAAGQGSAVQCSAVQRRAGCAFRGGWGVKCVAA
jgi:hypothetical protein